MKIDNTEIIVGSKVVDTFLGMGTVTAITAQGFTVSFEAKGSFDFLDGGYLSGVKRLGFVRKVFVELPIDKTELVIKVLLALGVTIKEGY